MLNFQSSKQYTLFLAVILVTAVLFVFLIPIYQGPDEQIHYGTIQYQAEPKEKTWSLLENQNYSIDGNDIASFHLSEETIQGGKLNQFDEIKWQSENIQNFLPLHQSLNKENSFEERNYKQYIDIYPSNASGTNSFYYIVTSQIEKATNTFTFFERFYNARLFSALLYLGTVLITYLITKRLFSSSLHQTLFTLLVAFQPMLLATGTIVNIDIALIFSFTLFFLGALGILRDPTAKVFYAILLFSLVLAFYSKGPGIALLPVALLLSAYLFQKKYHFSTKTLLQITAGAMLLFVLLLVFVVPHAYLASITNAGAHSAFDSPYHSLHAYISKTSSLDAMLRTHTSYWGNFGWLDTKMNTSLLHTIALIEVIAWLGIILFFLSQKIKSYLPKKLIIILSLGVIFSLQLAIRFYDWRVFDTAGKVVIGTPGRYFLPTIIPHMLILVTGLGFLFTKNKAQFTTLLKALTLGMILLCLYSIFNVIIPRYYL